MLGLNLVNHDPVVLAYDERGHMPVLLSGSGDMFTFDQASSMWDWQPWAQNEFHANGFSLVYDRVRGTAVSIDIGQVEAYNLEQSTQANVAPLPVPAFWPQIADASAVYDAKRERIVALFSDGTLVERPSK